MPLFKLLHVIVLFTQICWYISAVRGVVVVSVKLAIAKKKKKEERPHFCRMEDL
jgi:hypothetical protein